MSNAPYWRLMWKEYRTVRGFWLAIAALSIAGQTLTLEICRDEREAATIVFNLALGTPVFFALGAAGMAFAIEKEEGTFDFLRAAPISARQIITSKLTVAVVGTLLMFPLLCAVALGLLHDYPRESLDVSGALGLWLPAAVEAIAWGMFFSLRSSRPLVAICLAVAAASTSAHLLAWSHPRDPLVVGASDFAIYLAAAPLRVPFALAILWLDIVLAKRWLRDDDRARESLELSAELLFPYTVRDDDPILYTLYIEDRLVWRTWRTMMGHLLWLGWRQSVGATLLMMGLIVFLPILANGGGFDRLMPSPLGVNQILPGDLRAEAITLPVLATLLGSFVFMADKERRRLRFLVEHNISPRYVWLSRQFHWIAALLLATACVCLDAGIVPLPDGMNWPALERADTVMNGPWTLPPAAGWQPSVLRPLALLFLLLVAIPYTAGQWASMMIRSSVMAGLTALLLAAVLCGWVAMIGRLNFPWLWPVVAVPLLLLWATWFRAPDWIREDTSWRARGRAAAAALGPALVLLIAVPLIRVYQIPWVDSGYDRQQYPPPVSREGQATADLYRRAMRVYVPLPVGVEEHASFLARRAIIDEHGPLSTTEVTWLRQNERALVLSLEASSRSGCDFGGPRAGNKDFELGNGDDLTALIVASARELEASGQLDEALERFFAAERVNAHLSDPAIDSSISRNHDWPFVLNQIAAWGAAKGQTPPRVEAAVTRLQRLDSGLARLEGELKIIDSGVCRYLIDDEAGLPTYIYWEYSDMDAGQILLKRLLPWEKYRGRRMLNAITATGLDRLRGIHHQLAAGTGVVDLLQTNDRAYNSQPVGFWNTPLFPPLNIVAYETSDAAWRMVEFEAWRRASVLLLAIEAHKLRHGGQLPASLAELIGHEVPALPKDPYSGSEFRYFPAGLGQSVRFGVRASLSANHMQRKVGAPWLPESPCIWCSGPTIEPIEPTQGKPGDAGEGNSGGGVASLFYDRERNDKQPLSESQALGKGYWFPIPASEK